MMVSIYEDPDLVREGQLAEAMEESSRAKSVAISETVWVEPGNEDHWHKLRAANVTSTESSALFGLSPYNTKFELWHRKREGAVVHIEDNDRMAWGRRLQDAIAYGVGEEQGWKVTALTAFACVPSLRMGSSFDFQAYDPKRDRTGILEIKNVDYAVYKGQWLDDEAPDHIEIQLQHQLEISGNEWGCIAALVGGNTLKLIIRERDAEMGKAIRSEIAQFWQSIEASQEPKPDFELDAETISRLFSKSGGGERVIDDPRLESLCMSYLQALEDHKTAEAVKEALSAEIKTIIGNADAVYAGGHKISAKAIAENIGTLVTPEMVGQRINARKGYRPLRVTKIKEK